MARRPEARFASAAEMRAALTRAIEDLPEAPPASAAPPSATEEMLLTPPLGATGPALFSGASGNTQTGTRTPTRFEGAATPSPSSPSSPRRWFAHPLTLVAAGAVVAVGATQVARFALPTHDTSAPSSASASAPALALSPATKDEMDRARDAWRAGNPKASAMLHAVYDDVDHAGAKPLTPTGRVAAEALFLIADLEERGLRPPPAKEPTSPLDIGVAPMVDIEMAASKALRDYLNVGAWGFMDLAVCGVYRAGRAMEAVLRIDRDERARQLVLFARPSVQAMSGLSRADFERSWSSEMATDRHNALAEYEGAVMMSRSFPGPFRDPTDGSDCVAASLHRRDVLAAEADAGP